MLACAMIQKLWFWPVLVPGKALIREFDDLELNVGDSLAISGKLDGKEHFFGSKGAQLYNEDDGNGRAATCK